MGKKNKKVFISESGDIENKESNLTEDSLFSSVHKVIRDVNKKELPNVITSAREIKKTISGVKDAAKDVLGKKFFKNLKKKSNIHTLDSYNNLEMITTIGLGIVLVALVIEFSRK